MKVAILINEDFYQMVLGVNSTLSYILAAVDLEHDVYVCNIDKNGEISDKFQAIFLNKNNAKNLVELYQKQNRSIADSFNKIKDLNLDIKDLKKFLVKDFFEKFETKEIKIAEIDFLIQRLEPMKSPFPPYGKIDINQYLSNLRKKFSQKLKFNAPFLAYKDKELPLLFNFATPTAISFLNDYELVKKIKNISSNFQEKIVIKPDDSAQAYGVFSLEFASDGVDLSFLKNENLQNLLSVQSYKIKTSQHDSELLEILQILFFVQFLKSQKNQDIKKIKEFSAVEISSGAKFLYDKKILIQPFIKGVKYGDIRVILAKMSDKKFKIIAAVFRKNIEINEKNFTTGFMSGRSIVVSMFEFMTKEEIKTLQLQVELILDKLNQELYQKYQDVFEIGCDFILAGDKKNVFFGEANHHCQGLIPLAELVKENNFTQSKNAIKILQNDGIAIAKELISNWLKI